MELTAHYRTPVSNATPESAVVLLHGLGADGADLIDLASAWGPALPHTLFIAPDAPFACDMAPFGRQWFSLQDRSPHVLLQEIQSTSPIMTRFLVSIATAHKIPPSRIALMGFSQGAMLALYTGLSLPACAGILAYSGAFLGPTSNDVATRNTPVMLIHGDSDTVVPATALDAAVQALKEQHVPTESHLIPGLGHGIDNEGLRLGQTFLQRVLKVS